MTKRIIRRKLKPGRVLLVLLVPVAMTGTLIYGAVRLFSPKEAEGTQQDQKTTQTAGSGANTQTESASSDQTDSSGSDSASVQSSGSADSSEKEQKNSNQKDADSTSDAEENPSQSHSDSSSKTSGTALSSQEKEAIETIKATAAGNTVDVSTLGDQALQSLFYEEAIGDELLASMEGVTYVSGYDFISPEDLRLLRVLYKDYSGQDCVGELIVNQQISEDALGVFEDLYEAEYPIAQIVLPDVYGGDDNTSMAANNTSAFSFRLSDGVGVAVHEHSLGLAIDINPLQNPQVIAADDGSTMAFPYAGLEFADRTIVQPHMINHADPAYQIFTEHGFSWGGDWSQRQDYMHFEKDYDQSWYRIIG